MVYNHVMSADDFCINKFVPGYFSRINEDGSYSNGSGCGNDTASERNMVRKYIVDSVCYWADVFEYYKGLIKFRKAHPALRLSTSEDVKKYVKSVEGLGDNIVGINIKGGQKDESAKEMYLLFNANTDNAKVTIPTILSPSPSTDFTYFFTSSDVDNRSAGCAFLNLISPL